MNQTSVTSKELAVMSQTLMHCIQVPGAAGANVAPAQGTPHLYIQYILNTKQKEQN